MVSNSNLFYMTYKYCYAYFILTAAVKARFESIRSSYRRYRVAVNKSLSLGKSGSGAGFAKQPKPYKYAAEAAFLDATFKLDAIIESMDSVNNSSNEVGCSNTFQY